MKVCFECRRCFDDDVEQCSERHGPMPESRPGSVSMIGGYRLEEHLYSGLRGDRFRATRMDCGLSCIVRIIKTDAATGRLFLDDAKRAADIFHPRLTAVYESGTLGNGELFLVSEDAAGSTTLRDRLDADLMPELLGSVRIVRSIAETLHELHQADLIFRSLCPENILIADDDKIRLQNIDLGGADQHAITSNKFLIDTETTAIRYFAPEQCSGEPATPSTDVYSLGVLLYELIAGVPPFDGARASEVIEQHRHSHPPDVKIDDLDLRMLISHTLMESLSKRGDLRQASADLFARQLRHIEQLATHVSTPPPAVHIAAQPITKQAPRLIKLAEADIDLPDLEYGSDRIDDAYASPAQHECAADIHETAPAWKEIDPEKIRPIDFREVREQMQDLLAGSPTAARREAAEPRLIRWDEPLDDIPSVEETLKHLETVGAEIAFDANVDEGSSIGHLGALDSYGDELVNVRNSQQTTSAGSIELGAPDASPSIGTVRIEQTPRAPAIRTSVDIFSSMESLSAVRFSRVRRGIGVGAAFSVLALAFAFRSDIVGAFTIFDLDSSDPSGLRTVASAPATVRQQQPEPVITSVEEVISEPEPSSVELSLPITHGIPRDEPSAAPAAKAAMPRDTKPAASKRLDSAIRPTEVAEPITPSTIVITYGDPKTRVTKERDPFAKPKNAAGMTRPRIVANPKP